MTTQAGRSTASVTDVRFGPDGLRAKAARESVLDVLFDGRRIWSFWLQRDGVAEGDSTFVAWPKPLRKFLHGQTRVSVVVHATGEVVHEEDISFGSSTQRIEVVDAQGNPLATDKTGHLVKTFANRSAEHVAPLLDAVEEVLDALRRAGVEAFLAYGTLLGAVREGQLIGHDSDADLGYVSAHDHPVDVIRESFRLQAKLAEMGYPTHRYSGGAFKVNVREADGSMRGLDVFGGFMRDGYLHLMGEIRTPFRREWVFPLATATLEGRTFPVPANSDRFLAATYGESWRSPDPAFKFETPASTYRRLNGWFRGIRVNRGLWDGVYAHATVPDDLSPSALARFVVEREGVPERFVDLGCGRGVDAWWMATQGSHSIGLDHSPKGFAPLIDKAAVEGVDVTYLTYNLLELRSLLATSALVAAEPGPRVLLARHLVDSLDARGRQNLWHSAQMMLRGGGSLYLEFLSRRGGDRFAGRNHVMARRAHLVGQELRAAGASIDHREMLLASGPDLRQGEGVKPSRICRMVASWHQ